MSDVTSLTAELLQEGNVLDLSTENEVWIVERLHSGGVFNNYGLMVRSLRTASDYEVSLVVFPQGRLEGYEVKEKWGVKLLHDSDIGDMVLDYLEDVVRGYPYYEHEVHDQE